MPASPRKPGEMRAGRVREFARLMPNCRKVETGIRAESTHKGRCRGSAKTVTRVKSAWCRRCSWMQLTGRCGVNRRYSQAH